MAAPVIGHAASVEVGAGVAQARTQGNGVWYQEGFQHSLNLHSPAFLLGVTGDLTPDIAWHVDAISLGSYSVDSQDTPNDANYSGSGYRGNALPLAHYMGSGSVYGIAATIQAHTQGKWQFGVQAGPFLYHSDWTLAVPNWYPSAETAPGVFVQTGPISPINVSQSQWALGYTVAASLKHGPLSLVLSYYADGHGFSGHGADPWPPLWKGQTVLMILYTF
jgi:hypothetical protein